jgi:DNA-binding transcriptional regulator YiaG
MYAQPFPLATRFLEKYLAGRVAKGYDSPMKPDEIRRIRRHYQITSDQLASRIGVTGNTVRRWECGVRRPGGAAAKVMRSMLARAARV